MNVILKNNLKVLMAKRGFKTIKSLSKETGLHANTLYALSKNQSAKMNLRNICKLLWLFDCPFEELFEYQVNTKKPLDD